MCERNDNVTLIHRNSKVLDGRDHCTLVFRTSSEIRLYARKCSSEEVEPCQLGLECFSDYLIYDQPYMFSINLFNRIYFSFTFAWSVIIIDHIL